jgi:hypothetical protein
MVVMYDNSKGEELSTWPKTKKGEDSVWSTLESYECISQCDTSPPRMMLIIITRMVERNNVTMPCHPRPSPADKSHVGCRIAPSIAPRLS